MTRRQLLQFYFRWLVISNYKCPPWWHLCQELKKERKQPLKISGPEHFRECKSLGLAYNGFGSLEDQSPACVLGVAEGDGCLERNMGSSLCGLPAHYNNFGFMLRGTFWTTNIKILKDWSTVIIKIISHHLKLTGQLTLT